MPEVYLASSALIQEGFESKRTIEEATKAGFAGVQLFLDPRYKDAGYRNSVIEHLEKTGLGLVLHLPNTVDQEDIEAARDIIAHFPNSKVLIHYLPETQLPAINGATVGWENSKNGPLDDEMLAYLEIVREQVKRDDTFYVFDMGRLLYAPDQKMRKQVIAYIKEQISRLDPKRDIVHLSDKTSWILKFRDCMCVLGEGVVAEFIEDIRSFEGIIVFEHENLEMALQSLRVL